MHSDPSQTPPLSLYKILELISEHRSHLRAHLRVLLVPSQSSSQSSGSPSQSSFKYVQGAQLARAATPRGWRTAQRTRTQCTSARMAGAREHQPERVHATPGSSPSVRTGCIRAAATVWCAGALGGRGIAAVVAAVAAPQAAGGERGWGAASEAPVCLVTPRCSCGKWHADKS